LITGEFYDFYGAVGSGVGRSLLIRAWLEAFIDRSAWQERPKSQCKAQIFDFRGVVPRFAQFRQTACEINGLKKIGV
jgi:hypothetical protein